MHFSHLRCRPSKCAPHMKQYPGRSTSPGYGDGCNACICAAKISSGVSSFSGTTSTIASCATGCRFLCHCAHSSFSCLCLSSSCRRSSSRLRRSSCSFIQILFRISSASRRARFAFSCSSIDRQLSRSLIASAAFCPCSNALRSAAQTSLSVGRGFKGSYIKSA